jgi:hypothetical protein
MVVFNREAVAKRGIPGNLCLKFICMIDVLTDAESRNGYQCHDYHSEGKDETGFEGLNLSDPGDGREERKDNHRKVFFFEVC